MKFKETGGGSNYTAFQAPSSLTGDVTFTLPDGDGNAGQVLSTNGSGTLSWANGGSGSGGINYLEDNPDAEAGTTGWATYADSAGTSPVDGTGGSANVTWTQSSSSPLRGTYSFLLTKDAANRQGEGVSYDFTISAADKAKVLQVSFDYIVGSGTFAAGSSSSASDVTVWLYDVTNSLVIQPSSYKLLSSSTSIATKFDATFQTASDSTSYRLILHVGSTSSSAYTVKFDNFIVGPSTYVYGTPVTDSQEYTPTFTGFGTVSSTNVWQKRIGDLLYISGRFTPGTTTATEARVSLPSGLTIDSTKMSQIVVVGMMGYTPSFDRTTYMTAVGGTTYLTFSAQSTGALANLNGSSLASSGETISFFAKVPIQGWSSSVQTSDQTDTRVVSFVGTQVSEAVTANTTNIAFTLSKDTHGGWSTNTYTVQVPGDYVVSGSLVTNTGGLTVVPYLNGSASSFLFSTANSSGHVTQGSVLFPSLSVGDVLSLRSNTSATLTSGAMQIFRLSGPSAIAATETIAARYSTSSTASISNASPTIIDFDTKSFDTHGAVTTGGSWKFTSRTSAIYRVSVSCGVTSGGGWSVGESIIGYLYKNNVQTEILFRVFSQATHSSSIIGNGDTLIQLNDGDYIDFRFYQDSGAALGLNGSIQYINIERIK